MKIAISCDGNSVSEHFGRCEKYILLEVKDGKLLGKTELPNPGHEPFYLPKFLKGKGVGLVMCKGIGPRAIGLLKQLGIEVVAGVSGNIEKVIERYLEGDLEGSESTCEHLDE